MVTGKGEALSILGAARFPANVEVGPLPGIRGKGPVVTPFTCTSRKQFETSYFTCAVLPEA